MERCFFLLCQLAVRKFPAKRWRRIKESIILHVCARLIGAQREEEGYYEVSNRESGGCQRAGCKQDSSRMYLCWSGVSPFPP